jgi:hypothetical protein
LVDFLALLGVGGVLEFEFEVRQDAKQRVVNFVRSAKGELGERGVFFVFGELGAEMNFVFVSSRSS